MASGNVRIIKIDGAYMLEDLFGGQAATVINIVLIVVCALFVQQLLRQVLRRITSMVTRQELFKSNRERKKRIKTLNSIIGAGSALLVWFVAALMIMQELGIPIAPLLTSAGLIGAAVAFGTQSIIRDLVSGIMIIAEDRYKVDDYVEIHGGGGLVRGRVEAVNVRATILRVEDGSLIQVPNGSISSTSNKSIPNLKAFVDIAISNTMTVGDLSVYLQKLTDEIARDDAIAHLFKGPLSVAAIQAIGEKKTNVRIEYGTSAKNQDAARSVLLQRLAEAHTKKQLKLA